ncbi:glycosyltransferase family 2 protein [Nocardia rhamnosiphila]|uniref:glycosyltransferase family 2 protein n=1 Tax=Nocardia rhamnosiphila TaxID=426716 RepID=UPI0004C3F275|nr:glycosyltransferase family 2 protein [Nocardia rhamnosiphila]
MTVVLPCRNEAGALPGVLAAIPMDYGVIVVDNGSTDATAAVAEAGGARVITEARPGYGSAVQAGVDASTTELVAVLDGDGSMDPTELPGLIAELTPEVTMVAGRRRPVPGAWPWHARFGNWILATWLRRRYGLEVRDLAAMRVVRRAELAGLGPLHPRSGYPLALLARAASAGWRVIERDITYRPRSHGVSKVSGSLLGALRAARDFWSVR